MELELLFQGDDTVASAKSTLLEPTEGHVDSRCARSMGVHESGPCLDRPGKGHAALVVLCPHRSREAEVGIVCHRDPLFDRIERHDRYDRTELLTADNRERVVHVRDDGREVKVPLVPGRRLELASNRGDFRTAISRLGYKALHETQTAYH